MSVTSLRQLLWSCALLSLSLSACAQDGKIKVTQEPLPLTERGPGTVLQSLTVATEAKQAAQVRCAQVVSLTAGPKLTLATTLATSPGAIAQVGVPWTGRIVGVEAEIGQQVRQGQPLVRIDTAEMHRLVQDFMAARAQAKRTADALERQQQLVEDGVGVGQEISAAEAAKAAALATLNEVQEQLHDMGLSDNEVSVLRAGGSLEPLYSTVRAPVSGLVEAIEASMGQMLQGGETLVRILASEGVWAVMHLPASDLGQVRLGMPVAVATVGQPQHAHVGTISAIGEALDANTQTSEVRVALNNADGQLEAGMSGMATLQLGRQSGGHYLPDAAVQTLLGGPMAFRCNKDGTFAAVRVAVGDERAGVRSLVAGLKHTDAVVTHGAAQLRAELLRQEPQTP